MIAFALILIFVLFQSGIINKTRSVLSGRRGYTFFQPLYNVTLLLRKGAVYSNTSTIITRLAAPIYLASIITASLFIPMGRAEAIFSFNGDIVLVALMLAAGRIALVLTAFDTGSPFQGMGSSRELFYGMLGEPALYLLLATLAMATGHFSLTMIFAQFENSSANLIAVSLIVGFGLFKLMLAECGRVPVDDTCTHLELTMIHEAMVLDLSGVDLAFVQIASWLKLSFFSMLIANAIIPPYFSLWLTILMFVVVMIAVSLIIGLLESLRARNNLPKNAIYLATISAIGVMAMIIAYITINGMLI